MSNDTTRICATIEGRTETALVEKLARDLYRVSSTSCILKATVARLIYNGHSLIKMGFNIFTRELVEGHYKRRNFDLNDCQENEEGIVIRPPRS